MPYHIQPIVGKLFVVEKIENFIIKNFDEAPMWIDAKIELSWPKCIMNLW